MRKQTLFTLAMIASLCLSSPTIVQAQSPAPAASAAPAHKNVDTGATMKSVLAKLTLSPAEKAKTDKILADQTLKGAKRRDAVEAVLTPEHLAQFKSLWSAAHHHKSKTATTPAASPSASPAK